MVWGEDEGGAVREDFGEVSSAVPAASEGADAIVATEVGEGGDALGDRTLRDVREGGLLV